MSIENIFLNRINELDGMGLSDILLSCVDVIEEERNLVLTSADNTAEALLDFRQQDGEKLYAQYKKGYKKGYKAKLQGAPLLDIPYTTFTNEQAFWGWFDGWSGG